jgi:endonuclease/exonuclease/phosphatase family metal-dependent hydrolase
VLIRSWNLFHGRPSPPGRRLYLEEAVALVTADHPDVVLLQEVPAWALARLGAWSALTAIGDVAQRPRLGPLPIPAELGRLLTALHPGVLRSAFSGQGNAILLGPRLRLLDHEVVTLNPPDFQGALSRELGLSRRQRRAWAKERRICSVVRLEPPLVVANLHATSSSDRRLPAAELRRVLAFVDAYTRADELAVLGGDFNVDGSALAFPGWSPPGPGIDHLLVRGGHPSRARVWPAARRRRAGMLLSDHAPVEIDVELDL